MRLIFSILLVLPVLAFCCESSTHYEKDGQCCKMCGPGKRMKLNTDCEDPTCQDCENGEYQDSYTKETKCKPQPLCDPNLNFEVPADLSKTKRSRCQCIPDHHCSSSDCSSCVRNTVCQPGEKVSKSSTRTSDTPCEPCPLGTFSDELSAMSCKPWTECSSGYVERPGSSTSDSICEPQSHVRLGVGICVAFVIFAAIVGFILYCFKKGRSGSACLEEKMQKHCPALCNGINNNHQPFEDKISVENEREMNMQPVNVPQEDTEDPTKQDDNFKNGLSANGMPVDQDHSKTSLLSQPETSPSDVSYLNHS